MKNDIWTQLDDLGLKPGVSIFLESVRVTQTKKVSGFNLAGLWQHKILGVIPKKGWFILTNLKGLKIAITAYKKRFDIEEMFRNFKSGGYNLEDTNVSGRCLIL